MIHPALRALGGPSATLAINERSNALKAEGREIHKLGLGQSPFPVPPHVVEALREHAGEKDYLPVRGLAELRRAVADFHRRTHGVECCESDVLIGPGSKELMFLLQLAFDGTTLLPSPAWVSYQPQATITGRPVARIDTCFEGRWRITPKALDQVCRAHPGPKLLILNYPGNPDGLTYSRAELEALTEVLRRHEVLALSDEIYGPVHHEPSNTSLAELYPEGTIISGGLSKWCGAGGWRLGTFTFPAALHQLQDAVAIAASETFTSVSAPIQYAAVTAFAPSPAMDDYLDRSRRILKAVAWHCTDALRAAGARLHDPQGGFYLLPDFSPLKLTYDTSAALCEALLEDAGIACLPGSVFGRPAGEHTLRLAYVDFDGAAALAYDGPYDETFICERAPRIVTAMEKLRRFLAR